MGHRSVFFAGGGTGGHIYPAIAVAEKIRAIDPDVSISFFCSSREIDARILKAEGLRYTTLPAKGFSVKPGTLVKFVRSYMESRRIAERVIHDSDDAVVVGVGGFVAAPACHAARKVGAPVKLVNVDIVPGKANKLIARWASEAYVQFAEAGQYFAKKGAAVKVVGCPLRQAFESPNGERARRDLGLSGKKVLLVTGASSGATHVNEAVSLLLEKLERFADEWQIVHLTGRANVESVRGQCEGTKIAHKIVGYYDRMADLLAAAEVVIGRSGAVSVAEYAAAGVAAVCLPYPYHKDRHQYLNAAKLVDAGAGVVVEDVEDGPERARLLWEKLEPIMGDDDKRAAMRRACAEVARPDAARQAAEGILG